MGIHSIMACLDQDAVEVADIESLVLRLVNQAEEGYIPPDVFKHLVKAHAALACHVAEESDTPEPTLISGDEAEAHYHRVYTRTFNSELGRPINSETDSLIEDYLPLDASWVKSLMTHVAQRVAARDAFCLRRIAREHKAATT
jgi:hypothetical protein